MSVFMYLEIFYLKKANQLERKTVKFYTCCGTCFMYAVKCCAIMKSLSAPFTFFSFIIFCLYSYRFASKHIEEEIDT